MKKILFFAILIISSLYAIDPREELILRYGCETGNRDHCSRLGQVYIDENEFRQNLEVPITSFKKACEAHSMIDCWKLANLYARIGNREDAVKTLEKICKMGGGDGCYLLGTLYDTGLKVVFNPDKALAYYAQSCDLKHREGCLDAGIGFFDTDIEVSEHFFSESCKLDSAKGCFMLGTILQKRNDPFTVETLTKACGLGNAMACASVADIYKSINEPSERNLLTARAYYVDSCNLDYYPACVKAGNMYMLENHRKAKIYFSRACRAEIADGCKGLALLYLPTKIKSGIMPNEDKAIFYFKRACELGDRDSCKKKEEIIGILRKNQ